MIVVSRSEPCEAIQCVLRDITALSEKTSNGETLLFQAKHAQRRGTTSAEVRRIKNWATTQAAPKNARKT